MLRWLMNMALKERGLVVAGAVLVALGGILAFRGLDIEAYPDPLQPEVELVTQPLGMSAEEVERLVTVPLEWGLAGMLHLQKIRTISLFGLSDVKLYFDWSSDYYRDRAETLNRLAMTPLPLPGAGPQLSPENPIGEIMRYEIVSPDHDLMKEAEVQDWIVRNQLRTIPDGGVEDASRFGGLTKEYHVDVDAEKLAHYGVSLTALTGAVADANMNVGGSFLDVGDQAFDVRGIGFIKTLDDIGKITISAAKGTPVRVQDVADAAVGFAPRLGIVGRDDVDEIVEGVVLMRKYGDTLKTLKQVEDRVKHLNGSGLLPKGFKVVSIYDRTDLVRATLRTVFENVTLGILIVFLVLIFFLGSPRAALIAVVNIPLAMCGAFILLYLTNTPANLLSLGAVDFGIIIDSTIIVVENIFRHMVTDRRHGQSDWECIRGASREVGGPMLYSTVIFLVAFLPLFTMRGVEGVIFSPMSRTYAFALIVAIVLAVTLSPVLCSFYLHQGIKETENPVWENVYRFYHNLNVKIVERPKAALGIVLGVMVAGLAVFPLLGGEFLPKLEEGNIWARATLPLTTSLENADRVARGARRVFKSFPEVKQVVSQLGRPDDGTDVTGFSNIEFFVDLKPTSQWPWGMTKEKLTQEMDDRLRRKFPEASFGYSQYISDNVEEGISGVKGQNAVKVYGPDLDVDENVAGRISALMRAVRGMADIAVYRSMGQPNVVITPDRAACSRYGLNVGDVNAVVSAAIGGQAVTQVLEGDRAFNLVVRWRPEDRESLDAIRRIRISLPGGGFVPLAQVAGIESREGASIIYREGLRRYVPIRFSVRGRDMQSAIEEAKRRIAEGVKLPEGVTVSWAGEYGELQDADRRLMIIVPLALLIIACILYWATLSLVNTLILMGQIPLACLGGVVALAVTRTPFSVSAAVGFISIFAIAIMDGILMNFYIRQLWDEGHALVDCVVRGCDRRMRAVIMTALIDGLGLLPAAMSTRIGAQSQRPLAIVIIGGSLSIALLTRVFQPTLVLLLHKQLGLTREEAQAPGLGAAADLKELA